MGEAFIRFENVEKIYGSGEGAVRALHDASFTIGKGEICVIVGPSGAGKTTLLNILGGMDTLTSGRVFLNDREVSAFDRRQLADYRRRDIGFVFQSHRLFPHLTVRENLLFGRRFGGRRTAVDQDRLIEVLGIAHLLSRRPDTLSGGESQRVALGRAILAAETPLIMDEPLASRSARPSFSATSSAFPKSRAFPSSTSRTPPTRPRGSRRPSSR
mgnify:CR=1 FL=1